MVELQSRFGSAPLASQVLKSHQLGVLLARSTPDTMSSWGVIFDTRSQRDRYLKREGLVAMGPEEHK